MLIIIRSDYNVTGWCLSCSNVSSSAGVDGLPLPQMIVVGAAVVVVVITDVLECSPPAAFTHRCSCSTPLHRSPKSAGWRMFLTLAFADDYFIHFLFAGVSAAAVP